MANEIMEHNSNGVITRGGLYEILLSTIRKGDEILTYEDTKFLQRCVEKINNLPARWPDGERMTQSFNMSTDLVLKQDMIDAMKRDREADKRTAIICKITDEINKY